jgi:hypothetical protein
MIVTADPQGDFNATSQILRYSALAREVTVPRIPSVTSAIFGNDSQARSVQGGRLTPQHEYFNTQELEQATNEVARLSEECTVLSVRLTEEEIKRSTAEYKLEAAEERIREECWLEMEERLDAEKVRWRLAWDEEKVKGEAFIDGKLQILEQTKIGSTPIIIHEDAPLENPRLDELERENETLKARIRALEQELQTRSPTKKRGGAVLQENANSNIATNPFLTSLRVRNNDEDLKKLADLSPRKLSLRSSNVTATSTMTYDSPPPPPTTGKKQRKLTARKWDLGDPDDI